MPDFEVWESFFDPNAVIEALECAGAHDVVEFGCGYGTFTIAAAKRIRGRIFALDIDPEMVRITAAEAISAQLSNIDVTLCDFVSGGTGLTDGVTDFAMLFNILHIEEPVALLREAHRVLVPGGKAGIIHWRTDIVTPRGPSLSIRPSPQQCRLWGEEAGFQFERFVSLPGCPWHWGMILRRRP